jgi:1,4-dihydroxy-2-naphthoyl-CoA hydrolase
MPFAGTLGLEVLDARPDIVSARLAWAPELCTAGGVLHGGVLMSLADCCGGYCAFLNLPDERHGTTTIESKTNLLRAVREGSVTATTRPLHVGGRVVVLETELRDDRDRLVAKTTQTQAVLAPQGG